ncbi:testis specific protein Y-linked isoform X1 [Hippoglossus stenolepis]|uniref:testis specific protein Y-linked isoform X1 n=1 Tax=Hippoglossus stenolepis TaxID=195615 RepID=UPI00159C6E40|nr:testis specific protein Y-linked isoform X1 [Hippoglossus stenolepis]
MSEVTDSKQSADSASRKRCPSPDQDEGAAIPSKSTKVSDASDGIGVTSESCKNSEAESKDTAARECEGSVEQPAAVQTDHTSDSTSGSLPVNKPHADGHDARNTEKPQSSGARPPAEAREAANKTTGAEQRPAAPLHQSDSAAIAAAEALASLTGRDGENSRETPCSSEKAKQVKPASKFKQRGGHQQSPRAGSRTQAAAADSSTSVHSTDREDADEAAEADEGDDSISGSSSTPSSSFPSDNEDNEDGECAIVSVKMAPEMRQSVALLAQVQMRLEALEKKSARLHQRLELKISRLRRPHLDQRSSITKTIPGFWVTALLNHPHLSAHIDETDEDALSYMTDLEVGNIESFKNNKLGYRIRFHFRRNPYFQNNIIMKELHLGMGGSPMSFSNPILWHRGQNLTAQSEPRKSSRGVYQTFFSWFSDHSNPGQDDVAQILKDDLYRDPLRYYLTPLWEPRENGSSGSGPRAADNGNGDDCVVISDSDDDPGEDTGEAEQGHSRGREEEDQEEEDEEEEDEEEEEEEGDRGPSAGKTDQTGNVTSSDESPEEEDDAGEIVIDGSDDSDQEEEEDEA